MAYGQYCPAAVIWPMRMSQNQTLDVEIRTILRKAALPTSGISSQYEPWKVNDVYVKKFICASARRGDLQSIKTIEQDIGLNEREMMIILFVAARYGHVPILEYLHTEHKMSLVDSQDCLSPVMIASQHGQLEAVKYLVENGAIIEDRDLRKGHSCVYLAAEFHHPQTVAYLIEKGAEHDKEDIDKLLYKNSKKSKKKHTSAVNNNAKEARKKKKTAISSEYR